MAHNYISIHRVTKYVEYSRIVIQKAPIVEFICVSEVMQGGRFFATDEFTFCSLKVECVS